MPDFLLEIGCEELPAPWLPPLTDELRQSFTRLAEEQHLAPEAVRSLSTPRRLVLAAKVAARQPDREERVFGPALKLAQDAKGWTKAAEGFARKLGVSPDALERLPKDPSAPDELYLARTRREAGRPARDVLAELLPALLRSLSFPKRMSWDAWLQDGKGAFPFGRPIRWLLALVDAEVVPLAIHEARDGGPAGVVVESGRASHGHRFLPRGQRSRRFEVGSFGELEAGLGERFVLLDPEARARAIREGLKATGHPAAAGHPLAAEWRDLVEFPTVVTGRIPSEFQSLPVEVLQTVLVHHQKYVPLASAGRVARFAAVINSDAAASDAIVRGMERVVVARLRDAAFFYQEDLKRPLADRVADLAGVVFHRKLGTYRDKTERLVRLVDAMGAEMGLLTKPEHETARAAAELAKADLTTLMVREFAELQGVMGGIYLRAQGHPWPVVASAVQWHYHPVSLEEGSPPARALSGSEATVFGAVSLADKLDTLAGYFGLGEEPTGSRDPYGLRRAAQGVIRVLLDFWQADHHESRPDLRRLVEAAVAGFASLERPAPETRAALEAFLLERLQFVLAARGFSRDEVEAVLFTPRVSALSDVGDCLARLRALAKVRAEAREDFEQLAVAFKRANNILRDAPPGEVDARLLEDGAERELNAAVERLESANGSYEERLRSLKGLRRPVDRFFDDVLVMAEDPGVRANRLGLLQRARDLFYRIADISRLGG